MRWLQNLFFAMRKGITCATIKVAYALFDTLALIHKSYDSKPVLSLLPSNKFSRSFNKMFLFIHQLIMFSALTCSSHNCRIRCHFYFGVATTTVITCFCQKKTIYFRSSYRKLIWLSEFLLHQIMITNGNRTNCTMTMEHVWGRVHVNE